MVIRKAYRFRLEPDEAQQTLLHRFCGQTRFVWNKALALQKRRLECGIPLLRYGELAKYLTLWRASEEYGFLRQGPVHTQQQALKRLDCVACGFAAHADQVGAYNILSRGMETLRDEGRDTADASVGWLKEKLSSHSPDRLFAEVFGEPGPSPV